jgi:hypothetical protein
VWTCGTPEGFKKTKKASPLKRHCRLWPTFLKEKYPLLSDAFPDLAAIGRGAASAAAVGYSSPINPF